MMKKLLLPLALVLIVSSTAFCQVWSPQAANTLPSNYSVMNVSIVNDQVAWAIALDYNQWVFPIPSGHVLKVLRTTDGGTTWSVKEMTQAAGRITLGIQALDENTAIFSTSNFQAAKGLFRTTNGGDTWTQVLSGNAAAGRVMFFNDLEGVSVLPGSAMARTINGGLTWTPLSPNANYPPFLAGEDHLNTPTNYDIVGDTLWIGTTKGRIYRSVDRGQNWTVHQAANANEEFGSIAFTDSKNGLALVGNFNDLPLKLIKTTDGGGSWDEISNNDNLTEVLAIPCSNAFLGVAFFDSLTVFTKNLGTSWTTLDSTHSVFGPAFFSPDLGWASNVESTGPNPALFKWDGGLLDGRIYVSQAANGANDGSTWADAYTDLQAALAAAEEGDQIWVAEGTYKPAAPGGPQTSTFLINKNLKLYGGFAGTECSLSERDIVLHPTILSGDLEGDDVVDDFVTNRGDNVMTVVTVTAGVTNETVMDGFTVKGGHADGPNFPSSNGGGVRSQGSPIIRNCIFTNNFCFDLGGAISFRSATTGTSQIEDCEFIKNKGNMGGAIDIRFSDVSISNCLFSENESKNEGAAALEENGGAIFTQNSNVTLRNCSLLGNKNIGGGGGLFYWIDNSGNDFFLEIDSSHFEGNTASSGGAVFANIWGKNNSLIITSSTFLSNNSTGQFAYGIVSIYHQQAGAFGTALIENCLFEGNVSNWATGGLDIGSGPGAAPSSYSIKSCTFKNNIAGEGNAGGLQLYAEQNTDAQFEVLDCSFEGNEAGGNGGGLLLSTGSDTYSTTVSHCVFIGNKSISGGAVSSTPDLTDPATPTMAVAKFDNCLFTEHTEGMAAISITDLVNIELINCTVAENDIGGVLQDTTSSLTLQNTILANPGHTEYTAATGATVTSNGGNLVLDNSLDTWLLPSDQSGVAPDFDGGYFPLEGGNLVNAGVNDGVTALHDLAGNQRIQHGVVDIGVYESPFLPVGTREVIAGEIGLSPNPATDYLNLTLPANATPTDLSIFDSQGRLVEAQAFAAGQTLSVAHLPTGLYSLKLTDGEQVYVGRFVKQ